MNFAQHLAIAAIVGTAHAPLLAENSSTDLAAVADRMAQEYTLVDTHIDVPYRLHSKWSDVTQSTDHGDFDHVRARSGGLDIPFMSIYTPAVPAEDAGSFELANSLIDQVEAMVGRAPEKFVVVKNSHEAEKVRERGLMGLAMGMENGSPIEGKLENVAFFKNRGVSYITLAHSLSNHLSDSSYDEERKWNGLSPFGKEVVAEMNRVGMMVDVSHLSDEAFYDVLETSQVPVIASHSSARHFTPGWERNMSDQMIRDLAAKGGVIQVNFGSSFITEEGRRWFDQLSEARKVFIADSDDGDHEPDVGAFMKNYRKEHPFPFADMDDIIAHYRHIIDLVGVEHVGIGSDFDGLGDSLPEGMKDVSQYPNLVEEFLKMELSPGQIEAILGGNLLRVWRAADTYAEQAAGA